MTVLYIDAFAGISGDMTVGALLALGLPLPQLEHELSRLGLTGYALSSEQREVNGIVATRFNVGVTAPSHTHRTFGDIRALVQGSKLQPEVERHTLSIFGKLAEAEARVHGVPPEQVEFHEVGAIDSIIDIVGTALGIATFGITSAYVSPLPLGSGRVQTQHGPLPVPGPATLELLCGFATRPGDGVGELVTPTGAAIVAALATPDPPPTLRIRTIGYGAGERVQMDRPNLLRLALAEPVSAASHDDVVVIETNIDDFNPELYEHAMDRLFEAGARDVYLTPVHMKKNRPGVLLTVLGTQADRDLLAGIVLSETSAIGLRFHSAHRVTLERQLREVTTPYGLVRIKVAISPEGSQNVAPEYEDCKRRAREHHVPIKLVYQAALAAGSTGKE